MKNHKEIHSVFTPASYSWPCGNAAQVSDRQVSWLTDHRLLRLPKTGPVSVAQWIRPSDYSDEFAQASQLFPYYPGEFNPGTCPYCIPCVLYHTLIILQVINAYIKR